MHRTETFAHGQLPRPGLSRCCQMVGGLQNLRGARSFHIVRCHSGNIGVDVTQPGDFFSSRQYAQKRRTVVPLEVPMPKLLSSPAVEAYRRDGYHFPVPVLSSTEV